MVRGRYKKTKKDFDYIKNQLLNSNLAKSECAGLGVTRGLSQIYAPEARYKTGKEVANYDINYV